MTLYITIAVMSLLIAVCIDIPQKTNTRIVTRRHVVNRICLSGIFTLLFLLAAMRNHTGNDYYTYMERFHDIYYGIYTVTEYGFNIIVKAIYAFFNSECYLVVFALFAALTVFFFLRGIYKQSESFALGFFLYMALGLYFQCFNTVRYYFALSLVFCSMRYIIRKDYLKFILIILFASLFHKSVLFVIPIYFLATIEWKKIHVIIVTVLSMAGFFFSDEIMMLIMKLYPSYNNSEEYLLEGGISYVNIIRALAVLILCLIFYKEAIKDNVANRFYFYLNYAALLMYCCFSFIPFVSRLGYYLNVSNILLIPGIYVSIQDEKKKKVLKLLIIGFGIVYFAGFLYKAYGDVVKILPYYSWPYEDVDFIPLVKVMKYQ